MGKGMLGRVVDGLGNTIDGKGALTDVTQRRVEIKAPGIIVRKSCTSPCRPGSKPWTRSCPSAAGSVS